MTATVAVAPLLDLAQAAFLQQPVAINIASHDAALIPSVSRAYGCRISPDRRLVTVFVSPLRCRLLLQDLRAGAPVAVVFTRPLTHQALQLKANRAEVLPLEAEDRTVLQAYGEAFFAEILALGSSEYFCRSLVLPIEDDALAVTFAPTEMFEQTPGPIAGQRLGVQL